MQSFFKILGALLMLDKRSPWGRLGNLLIVLGICLLLVAALQSSPVPGPAREIAHREATMPVPPAEAPTEATTSTPRVTRREPQLYEPPTAAPQELAPQALSGEAIALLQRGRRASNGGQLATRLVLPTLGVDAQVVEVPLANRTWDVSGLAHEVAHLAGTANPGDTGNMVLSAHITLRKGAGPFLRLATLQRGDLAIVYAGNQAYTYRVVDKRYVRPTDVSVTAPTPDPIITLITCTNWDSENRTYRERVAVLAELVNEDIPWPGRDRESWDP